MTVRDGPASSLVGDAAVERLLRSTEPAIRRLAEVDLLGRRSTVSDDELLAGPLVSGLLAGQQREGGFGPHPYSKWLGAHWRLVSLVELGLPAGEPRAAAALENVLGWLHAPEHVASVQVIRGVTRAHTSQDGNALAVGVRLGRASDPRVAALAERLIRWQWPDGGWNCDRAARPPFHSSVNESLPAAWGLHEYALATGNADSASAAERAAGFFLAHRVYRSHRSDRVIAPSVTAIHYPPYWHYDLLQGLLVLSRMGHAGDPRAADAVDVLEGQRRADGMWHATRHYWRAPGRTSNPNEAVDWGMHAHELATLNALRVLLQVRRPR